MTFIAWSADDYSNVNTTMTGEDDRDRMMMIWTMILRRIWAKDLPFDFEVDQLFKALALFIQRHTWLA